MGSAFVVAPVLPTCSYLNYNTSTWETQGCFVASFNSTHVQCNCTHFTLFAVLAPKFNQLVPSAVMELTPENVAASPTGLVTVVVLLCIFAVVFAVAYWRDRAEDAQYQQLRLSKHEKWKKFADENKKTTLSKQVARKLQSIYSGVHRQKLGSASAWILRLARRRLKTFEAILHFLNLLDLHVVHPFGEWLLANGTQKNGKLQFKSPCAARTQTAFTCVH